MDLAVSIPAKNSVSFIYNGTPTTVGIGLSSASVTEGAPVTINISVSAGSFGWVNCFDGVIQVGAAYVLGAPAAITTSALKPGVHRLSCVFIGAFGYNTSASSTLTLVVNPKTSTGLAAAIVQPLDAFGIPPDLIAGDFNGDSIQEVIAADMNGDGKLDLVVLFTTSSPAFAVFAGNGDGTFQSPVLYSSTRTPVGMVVVDTNNDGRLDVVTAGSIVPGYTSPALEIFRGVSVMEPGGYQLNTAVVPANSGTITLSRAGSNNLYPAGTVVCLTATPAVGHVFTGWTGSAVTAANCVTMNDNMSVTANFAANPISASNALRFVPATPCRLVDTRNTVSVGAGATRSFVLPGNCGIPVGALAYSLNLTVVPHATLGYITLWPTGQGQPIVSTLNSLDGRIKSNAAIVPAGTGARLVYMPPIIPT